MKPAQPPINAPAAKADPEQRPGPLRFLCVEDDRDFFLLIRRFLLEARFGRPVEVMHCATLAEANSCLRMAEDGSSFDLAVLDMNLPDSFGTETFDQVHEVKPDMPIIILSGNEDPDLAVAMVQRGAQDYLPKCNLTSDLLYRSILYAFERNRLRYHLSKLNGQLLKTTEDLRSTQMQLIQAEKLDSLGRIAASVAHEVKNPLSTLLMGVAFFGNRRAELGEAAGGVLDCMEEAIERATRIVNEMLAFSRSETLQMVSCSVNALTRHALRMVETELIKRKIQLVECLAGGLPDVRADAGKLSQVIINLIMNAAQAMPEGGTIEIQTSVTDLQGVLRNEGLREIGRLQAGDPVVVIEVRDRGPGIPEELMSRIFEPFFTTKPTGEGTGLGLSVSKRIVELHRGHLEVANIDNPQGLCARILLKAVDETDSASAGPTDESLATAEFPA